MKDIDILSDEIVKVIKHTHGNQVMKIILYGSVARGNDTPYSDVDIAVIVKKYDEKMDEMGVSEIVDLELEYDRVISLLLIDEEEYNEWNEILPFYKNVKNEGVVLWNAA